jgi:hypothetical protein
MKLAISFTQPGPVSPGEAPGPGHAPPPIGGQLVALETAGTEQRYPWITDRVDEPFERITLFPGRALESLSAANCAAAIREALDRVEPDALGIVAMPGPSRWPP